MKSPVVFLADWLARKEDRRVDLCRLVEHVFRDVGLPWSSIAVVRNRDGSRYVCLVDVTPECLAIERLEAASVRAACLAWERLRLNVSAKDFYWRAEGAAPERRRRRDKQGVANAPV